MVGLGFSQREVNVSPAGKIRTGIRGTSSVVQELRIHLPVQGTGSILGRGTKIPRAAWQLLSLSTLESLAREPQLERSLLTATKDPLCCK